MKQSKYYIITILICLVVIVLVLIVTKSKKDDYLIRGKKSYEKHCANCHGNNGEGLQLLIPPLTDSKWTNSDSIVCIIKNGMDGSIFVNGKNFNSRMVGNLIINNDEIANIVSYIRNDFSKKPDRLSIQEVTEQLMKCK